MTILAHFTVEFVQRVATQRYRQGEPEHAER